MKIGAVTMAHRDEGTIRGTIACLAPFVDRHIVFINDNPYYGEYEEPDKTEEICKEFNVDIVKGNWEEHVLRNLGIKLCEDCDWMIGFDADEMMTAEDIEKLKIHLDQTEFNAVGVRSKVYWSTPDYILNPDPEHIKVCIVRPNSGVKYVDMQCVNSNYEALYYQEKPYITHHHLSFAWPKDILGKVKHYNHAKEIDGEKWYRDHFEKWKFGQKAMQPFGTLWDVKLDPLPDELRRYLCLKESVV